jgi:hypothetical protein
VFPEIIIDSSRSTSDDSRSITDKSKVILQLGMSFTIIFYNGHIFIAQAIGYNVWLVLTTNTKLNFLGFGYVTNLLFFCTLVDKWMGCQDCICLWQIVWITIISFFLPLEVCNLLIYYDCGSWFTVKTSSCAACLFK